MSLVSQLGSEPRALSGALYAAQCGPWRPWVHSYAEAISQAPRLCATKPFRVVLLAVRRRVEANYLESGVSFLVK